MGDFAKGALDKLADLVYAVAPGFVALLALAVAEANIADPDAGRLGVTRLFEREEPWKGVGVGVLLGLVSYAAHLAVLEDLMFRAAWTLARWLKWTTQPKPDIPHLTHERWGRAASTDPRRATAQAGLDETYLWVFFLYCSGYLVVGGGIALRAWGGPCGPSLAVVVVGLLFLLAGVVGDAKTIRHEVYLVEKARSWPPPDQELPTPLLGRSGLGPTTGPQE